MQILNQIIEILINAGIIQALFLILLLKKSKIRFSKANIWLSILLIALSVSIVHSYYLAPHLSKLFNNPFKITEPGIFLISPLLWFYIQSLVKEDFKFKLKHLLHFAPYLAMYILFIPFMHNVGFENYKAFLHKYSFQATIAVWMTMIEQFVYYFQKMIKVTKIHHKKVEDEFSNPEGFDVGWVRYFLSVFFIAYVLLLLIFVWFIHSGNYTNFPALISLIFALAVFFLGYKGLFQKEFVLNQAIDESEIILEDASKTLQKPETSGKNKISDQQKDFKPLVHQLVNYLDYEKPYLDPELTLTSLAQKVQLSRNTLSEVINSGMNDNFYNLINRYRVDQVKELINDPKHKDFTILAIAFDAGFASKATFNTIFKKFTGLTPSEYRNRLS